MDVEDLRRIGLLDHWEALDRIASTPLSAEDVEDVLEAADDVTRSRWSPEKLAEQLRLLPVAGLFPDLCAEVVEILGRWYQRFNLKTWSRIVKVCKGSAHQVPCVLKELNESAPVIQKVRSWVDSLPTTAPKACIVDLGAGFGFLSMLLAELLPAERVAKFFLLDMTYPNLGVGNSSGSTSIEHLKVGWKIPMYTLKVDLKKKTTLNQLAARVFRAPVSEEDTRWAPVYACGIHLCNTLGIRAAQLFNENVDVRGFAFVPCCFPTSRHLTQDVIYQLGEHQFAARDFLDAKKMPSNNDRFSRWAEHILEGIDPGPAGFKGLERHRLVRPRRGMFAQDVYIFAERPLEALPHAPWQRREEPEGRGKAVVIWAKYGHGKARKREVREEREAEKVQLPKTWQRIAAPGQCRGNIQAASGSLRVGTASPSRSLLPAHWAPVLLLASSGRALRRVSRRAQPQMRVFGISDVHTDWEENFDHLAALPVGPFKDDALLVAGDVSHDLGVLQRTMRLLLERFAHVFFVPGNHDVYVGVAAQPRSASFACPSDGSCSGRRPKVWTRPVRFPSQKLTIVPLLSWYHEEFDSEPDVPMWSKAAARRHSRIALLGDEMECSWPPQLGKTPAERNLNLAQCFDAANDKHATKQALQRPSSSSASVEMVSFQDAVAARRRGEHVLSMSHFLPRLELLPEKRFLYFPQLAKASGSRFLADRLSRLQPTLHLFGHTHFAWDQTLKGVRFLQAALGSPSERQTRKRVLHLEGGVPTLLWRGARTPLPAPKAALWSDYYARYRRAPRSPVPGPWLRFGRRRRSARVRKAVAKKDGAGSATVCLVWDLGEDPAEQMDLLSSDERQRAESFSSDGARKRFVWMRASLRCMLAERLGLDASSIKFQYGMHGKPSLAAPLAAQRCSFSVSHSGEVGALLLFTPEQSEPGRLAAPVGVDLELHRPRPFRRLAERFFTSSEVESLDQASSDPDDMLQRFFEMWTKKEAWLKSLGTGLAGGLHNLDCSVAGDVEAMMQAVDGSDASEPSKYVVSTLREVPLKQHSPLLKQWSAKGLKEQVFQTGWARLHRRALAVSSNLVPGLSVAVPCGTPLHFDNMSKAGALAESPVLEPKVVGQAPAKRPAASTAGAAAKKAKGPAIGKMCKEIASALKSSSYPKHVIEMLSHSLPLCLGETKEERHEFQARTVAMTAEVLASVQADLESKISGAEEKIASGDAEKTKREAAVEETKKAVEEKAAVMETTKKEAEVAAEELSAAEKAHKTAEQEQKAGDTKLVQAETKKEKLETVMTSVFVPCKDGTVEASSKSKAIQEITKLGRSEGFDTALLTSLPSALDKEPAARGTFDHVVVKQVEDELQKRLGELSETLAAGAPEREARAQKVSIAAAQKEAAKVKGRERALALPFKNKGKVAALRALTNLALPGDIGGNGVLPGRADQPQGGDLVKHAGENNMATGAGLEMQVDHQGNSPTKRRAPDKQEDLALNIDIIREAIRGELKDALSDVKQDLRSFATRVDNVENQVTRKMQQTINLLDDMTTKYASHGDILQQLQEANKEVNLRLERLEKGGGASSEAAMDVLKAVEAPIALDSMFVPGVRRGYAIVPIDDRLGEHFEQRKQRIQDVIAKVREANIQLGRRPDGGTKRVWIAMSQPPDRRRRARLAAKVKRLYLTLGGNKDALQMEFSTGTAWVDSVKVSSATAPKPGGTEDAGPGWVNLAEIAKATRTTQQAVSAAWSPLNAEIN
ncbi:unnamed protein product [Symbiodinium sp. CCMP2592]|nr:unnamed protein product [Symbiodinium sp. CCMP2592]